MFTGGGTLTKSTVYVGGLYESESTGLPTPVMAKHYIQAGGRVVAISTRPESGTGLGTFQYLHHDHLGSVDKVTDDDGDVAGDFSYDAFGKRRALNWLNDPTDSQLSQQHATDKGYTSQQQLDGVALIHYGGRVYDPILGRFTSADPIVQAPSDIQSYNRYAYVRNNPLSLTDPTGFSWVSKQWRRATREGQRWESKYREDIKRYVAYKVASGAALMGFAAGGPKGAIAAYHGTYKSVRAYQHGASAGDALGAGASRGLQAYGVASVATGFYNGATAGLAKEGVIGAVKNTAANIYHHVQSYYVRRELGQYAQRQWGISLGEFNLGLTALSFVGDLGSRYKGATNGVEAIDGLGHNTDSKFGEGPFNLVGLPFHAADILLQAQGLPTAAAWKYVLFGDKSKPLVGFSMGASDVNNLASLGLTGANTTAVSLPFYSGGAGGVNVVNGTSDWVNLGSLGAVLSPFASWESRGIGDHLGYRYDALCGVNGSC